MLLEGLAMLSEGAQEHRDLEVLEASEALAELLMSDATPAEVLQAAGARLLAAGSPTWATAQEVGHRVAAVVHRDRPTYRHPRDRPHRRGHRWRQ